MKTILLVDQEKNTTFTIQNLLESESFNVFSSHSLREAIVLLNARKFDLVVVSRDMPAGEELDIVQWLTEFSPQTQIITLTTPGSFEAKNQKVLAEYPKPLDFFSLVQTIKTSLMNKGFSGIMKDILLQDFIQMFCRNGATKAVLISQKNEKGIVLIKDGNVVYAMQDQLKGEEAFFRIMSWKKGTLKEIKIKKFPDANIHRSFNVLLIESARRTANGQAIEAQEKEDREVRGIPVSPEVSPGMVISGEDALGPAEGTRQAVQADITGMKSGAVEKGKAPAIRGKRFWLKYAAAVILPLLGILFGVNSFFFASGNSEVSAQQDSTSIAAAGVDNSPAQAMTGRVPDEKPQGAGGKPVEAATAPSGSGMPDSQKEPAAAPLPLSAKTGRIPETVILRLHGSNTIGAQLAPALARTFMKDILKAPRVEVIPGIANEMKVKAIYGDHAEIIEIQAHGSTTGFAGLAAKKCDIAMSSRRIKTTEIEQLKTFGDMSAITNEHVIALDGIAVIVNRSNPLQKLEVQRLADIFSGKISDWSAVQAKKKLISVYARDDKSGTFDTFKHIVLGKTDLTTGIVQRFESNPELSDKVAMDPDGIGFTSLPNIRSAKGLAIAEEGAEAIFPSFFTVATEDYPLSRRLYLYTETNPSRRIIRDFVEYTLSRAGQTIVKDQGFVDLNIKSFVTDATDPAGRKNAGLIRQYTETIKDSERLSVNFRFKNNQAELDNRGMRDLDRMIDYLKEAMGKKIILVGFADDSGEYEYNRVLALERAETVAKDLRTRGIAVNGVISAGEELPVASNTTAEGREKNRRVEVWVR